jgi:hypothetical protein
MRMSRTHFGGYSRARDGCIVTFRMPDDSLEVRHFATVISDSRRHGVTKGQPHIDQLIEWADEHEATVVTISTPETILRDLQGFRSPLDAQTHHKNPADVVTFPERNMLKSRGDLFEQPGRRR